MSAAAILPSPIVIRHTLTRELIFTCYYDDACPRRQKLPPRRVLECVRAFFGGK